MPRLTAQVLDRAILSFIRKYPDGHAPEDRFQALALDLFLYQHHHNHAYRKYCDASGVRPEGVRRWQDIPAMPADGFKRFDLVSFPAGRSKRVFKTSGTSAGERGCHRFDTLKLYDAAIFPSFCRYLLPDNRSMQFCFLVQSTIEAPDSSLSYMMSAVNKKLAQGKGGFYIGKDWANFGRLVRDMRYAKRPILLLATAFSLKAFLEFLENENIWLNLPEGSRLMETGGFKGRTQAISKELLYRLCGERLGIARTHCVSEYGMTELSSQAYDTTLRDKWMGLKVSPAKMGPAWMRTLVIDPKTGVEAARGHRGLLRHFDLANRGSVIAIQTEDVGVRVRDGFEVLSRAKKAEMRGCSLSYEKFISPR